jgi:hypothetical protein
MLVIGPTITSVLDRPLKFFRLLEHQVCRRYDGGHRDGKDGIQLSGCDKG